MTIKFKAAVGLTATTIVLGAFLLGPYFTPLLLGTLFILAAMDGKL